MNFPGEFFVDSTCINCDACRQIAPDVFAEAEDYAYVKAQPANTVGERQALQALLACPTGSIGTEHPNTAAEVISDFPLPLTNGVFYCGFNSRDSYGANSYFITHPEGNWLVDSPRFNRHLLRYFSGIGGIQYIFLTHQDDVADANKYAEHFGARRIIHVEDQAAVPDAEILIEPEDTREFGKDFRIVPTPGHTRGHCVLIHNQQELLSGDHLWWDPYKKRLTASRRVCWYSWEEQIASLAKLTEFEFSWVLPGHGQRIHLPLTEMHAQLKQLVARLSA